MSLFFKNIVKPKNQKKKIAKGGEFLEVVERSGFCADWCEVGEKWRF